MVQRRQKLVVIMGQHKNGQKNEGCVTNTLRLKEPD